MEKALIGILLALTLSGCCVCKKCPPQKDSVRIEYRDRIIHDTTTFEVTKEVEKIVTRDTSSVIENTYAKSEAVVSGGVLHHSLQTKPVREPLVVESKEVVRDSIVYRDRIQTVTVEVERKLSWWQRLKMKTGGIALLTLLTAVILFLFFNYLNLKKL